MVWKTDNIYEKEERMIYFSEEIFYLDILLSNFQSNFKLNIFFRRDILLSNFTDKKDSKLSSNFQFQVTFK